MSQKEYYTSEEISVQLRSLSKDDYACLMKMANNSWRNANLRESREGAPDDLLSEAIELTLSQRHKWKKDVSLRTHFWWVLRHVAGERARKGLNATKGIFVLKDEQDAREEWATTSSPVIEDVFEHEAFEFAKHVFKEDEIAWNVLESKILGKGKKAIMVSLGLDDRKYESTLKRIRRKLEKSRKVADYEIK